MGMQPSDVEILVHVNAPSRVADDTTYRQLAQAYLAFQPATRKDVHEQDIPNQGSNDVHDDEPRPSQRRASIHGYGSSSQPVLIDSQDLSFEGALDNRHSPRLPTVEPPDLAARILVASSQPELSGSQSSWCELPSQISDSYPMPKAAVFISPTRVLQRFVNTSANATPRDSSPSPSARLRNEVQTRDFASDQEHIPSSLPGQIAESRGLQTADGNARKIVPTTPVLAPAQKRQIDTEDRGEGDSTWDVTHISGSDVSVPPVQSPSRAESEPPPPKRARKVDPTSTSTTEINNLIRSSSDTATARLPSTPALKALTTLEIRAPSPPIGIDDIDPTALISEKLAKLATDLSSRYRPEESREVQPLERGYWLLDCTSWSPETRLETWAFLTSYIKSGLAGWGVWCRRGEAHDWIRLYCWGYIAKHTYLLLYLASGRNTKFTGAEWTGADGEVALKVLPHERQS